MSQEKDKLFDDEVSTGATLNSSTTIASNDIYHLGNDGSGSGLDADTINGNEPVEKNTEYVEIKTQENGNFGSKLTRIFLDGPGNYYSGHGFDKDDCLWIADGTSASIWKNNRAGDNLSTYDVSSYFGTPTQLDFDSSDCLWVLDKDDNNIKKLPKSINQVDTQFSTPCSTPFGVAITSDDCIFSFDFTSTDTYRLNQSGTVTDTINGPNGRTKALAASDDTLYYIGNNRANTRIGTIDKSGNGNSQDFSGPVSNAGAIDSYNIWWLEDSGRGQLYETDYKLGVELSKL